MEEGAYPYNIGTKIHDQCYKPNAELGNYSRISFNLGPTVLEWMSKADPVTLKCIIDQERKNYEATGIPNGMAQSYNHTILPLASKRIKKPRSNGECVNSRPALATQPKGYGFRKLPWIQKHYPLPVIAA